MPFSVIFSGSLDREASLDGACDDDILYDIHICPCFGRRLGGRYLKFEDLFPDHLREIFERRVLVYGAFCIVDDIPLEKYFTLTLTDRWGYHEFSIRTFSVDPKLYRNFGSVLEIYDLGFTGCFGGYLGRCGYGY